MNLSEGRVGVGLFFATLIPDLERAKGYADKLVEQVPDFTFQVRVAGKSKVVYAPTPAQNSENSTQRQTMLKEVHDAIVADDRNYDTLEFTESSNHIYITEGCGVDVFIEITDDKKYSMRFSAQSIHEDNDRSDHVTVSTVQEVLAQLNDTCWNERDWQ
jgi:hypothetical protein